MKGRKMELTPRLLSIAALVRGGVHLMDVGTDHAYLPIYLAEKGKICSCLASDVHEGPCESARAHIAENGLSNVIKVRRADGLRGLAPEGDTDIVIAGMGGALICEILEKADFIKNHDVRLILQPMRNTADVRAYLYTNGFCITDEALAREDERIYEIICAVYDGKERSSSELSLLLGEKNIENKNRDRALFSAFCDKHADALRKKIGGMQAGGASTEKEEALLAKVLHEKED